MGKDRAGAACEHRGHPEPLALEEMSGDYRVDARVLAVVVAGGRALLHGPGRECHLVHVENTVLPSRDKGRLEKASARFAFSSRLGHTAMLAKNL